MQSIIINENWFYRYITPDMFYKFIRSGGIFSERQLRKKKLQNNYQSFGWNGIDYISLSKREKNPININTSSYYFFSYKSFSLIINVSKAIKAHEFSIPISIAESLSQLFIPIRFTIWNDEYQVKNYIPMKNIIALKLPEKGITSLESIERNIDKFLSIMEETEYYLPFIDIEKERKIPHTEVKKYLKSKF